MMNRKALPFLPLLFCLCVASCAALPLVVAAEEDPRARLGEVRAQLQQLRRKLAADRKRESRAVRRLRETEQSAIAINRELQQLQDRLARQDRELQDLVARQQVERTTLAGLRSDLATQVRQAYLLGRQGKLRVMFTHDNPATVGRLFAYHRYIYAAHAASVTRVSAQLEKLAGLEKQVTRRHATLRALRQERREQLARLDDRREARADALRALKAEISRQDQAIARLEQDEARLRSLLEGLRKTLRDTEAEGTNRAFGTLKGSLPWPTAGRIRAAFGKRRGLGNLRWRGVLIASPAGSEVRAVSAGRVAFVDWLRGFGLLVILDHGGGFMSLYGFNQEAMVDEGAWVDGGEVISRVGDTGGQEKPGLYFELRKGAKPLDPAAWCAGRPSPKVANKAR